MSKFESENWKKAVNRRLDSFSSRKNYWLEKKPSVIRKVDGYDFEYITHYIMADEKHFLKKFNVVPEDCKQIDLYWKFDGDVAFVEIYSSKSKQTKLTARWGSGMLYLAAEVPHEAISTLIVESTLKLLLEIHLEENLVQKYYLKRNYRTL